MPVESSVAADEPPVMDRHGFRLPPSVVARSLEFSRAYARALALAARAHTHMRVCVRVQVHEEAEDAERDVDRLSAAVGRVHTTCLCARL